MKSSRNSIIISFGLGFLSCAVVVSIWHVAGIGGSTITPPRPGLGTRAWHVSGIGQSTITDDILNGRLKIKLASKLKEDKKASEELVELLRERWQCTRVVTGMEEDARGSDAAMDSWDKMYNETYLETLARLARFTIEHRDTTAGLTAKLVYTDLVPYLTGPGALTEKDYRRSANCDLLLNEILSQHPNTWQASIAICCLATDAPGDEKEHHREKIRLLKEYLKKELVEPPEDDPVMEILAKWCGPYEGPLKAGMLQAIADSQYNLGTLGDRRDLFWLNKAKKTYQELVKQYPEYSERNGWVRSHIQDIDKMIDTARKLMGKKDKTEVEVVGNAKNQQK